MVTFLNPSDIHAPPGSYSHTAAIPAGANLVFIAGQVGMRPDGSVPTSFAEQAELVFKNIHSCLAAHGIGTESVVKITSYLTLGQDFQVMREIRQRYFGNHNPPATAVYVPQLINPAFLLEVEVIAVKPASSTASLGSAT